jgi:hypothetical protein
MVTQACAESAGRFTIKVTTTSEVMKKKDFIKKIKKKENRLEN